MKKLRSGNISKRTARLLFALVVVMAVLVTFWFIFVPARENAPYPDWFILVLIWGFVFLWYIVVFWISAPINMVSVGKSYSRIESNNLFVGFYQCPVCKTRFTGDGYCSVCDPLIAPKLEFNEEVWRIPEKK